MPARPVLAIVVVCALLILGAGVGSALLLAGAHSPGSPVPDRAKPSATWVADAGTPGSGRSAGVYAPSGETPSPESIRPTEAPTEAPTATDTPTITSTPTPAPTDTPFPTPKPERVGGPVLRPNHHKGVRWVTLQAGHWNNQYLPEELAHLVDHTGAYAAGISEVDVNVAVAKLTAQRLYERGYSVEVLDATVPPNYSTDLFLAIHADGNAYSSVRGFKAVSPWDWGATGASEAFVGFLYEEYGKATGLPTDPRTSSAMANYYAFNPLKYRHALNRAVPAALLEMGFITNPQDRQVLATEQDKIAWGIANAVDRYFRSGAAGPTPSPYPTFTPTRTPTRTVTSTSTSTLTLSPTSTVTSTSTPTTTPGAITRTVTVTLTPTKTATPTRTPLLPTATRTPSPTSTPLTGTITTDGRWLPPVAPGGRWLPPLGSKSAPVLLSVEDDDPHGGYMDKKVGWHPHIWRQYYFPNLGRSQWIMGEAIPPKY